MWVLVLRQLPNYLSKSASNAANVFAIESADASQRLQFGVNTSNGGSYIFEQKVQALRFGTSDTERMIIASSGLVGIGTSSPTDLLSVGTLGSTASPVLTIGSATNGQGQIYFGDGAGAARYRGYIGYVHSSDSMTFGTSATERMRIDASGRVCIGVSSLNNPLEVAVTPNTTSKTSGSAFDGAAIRLNGNLATTNSEVAIIGGSDNGIQAGIGFMRESVSTWGSAIKFYTRQATVVDLDGVAERMRIDSSGNLLVGKTAGGSPGTIGLEIQQDGEVYSSIANGFNTYHVYANSGYRFYVNPNGGVYNYSANNVNLSDEREKKNIEALESQWDSLKQWSLKKFQL